MNRKLSNLVPQAVGNLGKTSFDQERERFELEQNNAIIKSLSLIEAPPKEKHVRKIIISTFQARGPGIFWRNLENTVPLYSSDITAWKFLIVFHRLMQDGDAAVISGSLKHSSLIDEVCRSHAQLAKSSYGQLVGKYGRMILGKLAFHSRNQSVPGNFGMKNKLETVEAGELFEMGVEFLDQLEATCVFMKSIFNSFELGNKSISLTAAGQCRLAALVPCTHDTSRLLELTTNLIRLLHLALPFDTLEGHRQRFHMIHKELRKLYEDMSHILFLRSMVQIPRLAEDITHFFETLKAMSSTTHHHEEPTYDMIKHEEDEDGELVSVADESVDASMAYIQQEYSDLSSRYQMVLQMLESEQQLRAQQEQENVKLKEQVEALRQASDFSQVSNDNSGIVDEKLEKLKAAYQKLRTDHITVLRQKGELDKKLIDANTAEKRSSDCLGALKSFLQSRDISTSGELEDVSKALSTLGNRLDGLQLSLLAKENDNSLQLQHETELQKLNAQLLTCQDEKSSLGRTLMDLDQAKTSVEEAWRKEVDWKKGKLSGFISDDNNVMNYELLEHSAEPANDDHLISYLMMSLVQLMPYTSIDGVSPDALYPCIEEILTGSSWDSKSQALKSFNQELMRQNRIAKNSKNEGSETQDVDSQIRSMQNTIEEAALAMEAMMLAARANENKKNIEVDIKILDSCSNLINAIQQLIKEAGELQAEIASTSGYTLAKDFYRNNQKWSQGLISAAKDIGRGAKYLVETSDDIVVNGSAKFEELSVAAHEIAGSTAQMVMASKVKADKNSEKLLTVSATSKKVSQATAEVIATCRACANQMAENEVENIDLMSLSVHHSKKLEMEVQIKCLELEKMLEKQREKLFAIRKHQYAKSSDDDKVNQEED